MEVQKMYKESETIELKRKVTSNLCKEIIAFANTNGGTIYIGYDDNSNLIGVDNAKDELDKISNMISDTIDPNLIFNISMTIINESGKDIIVIKVLKGTKRPYYLKNKGIFIGKYKYVEFIDDLNNINKDIQLYTININEYINTVSYNFFTKNKFTIRQIYNENN